MGQGPLNAYGAVKKNGANSTVFAPTVLDAQNAMQTADVHGRYYESAVAGRTFKGASQAGATLSAALATTYVGLCLSNPAASAVNLVIQRVSAQLIVAPSAIQTLGLIAGFAAAGITVHTTPLVPYSSKIGGGATSAAKLDAACTLVGAGANAPQWIDWLGVPAATAGLFGFSLDQNGSLVIAPGGYVAIGAKVAGESAGFVGAFEWEELPFPL